MLQADRRGRRRTAANRKTDLDVVRRLWSGRCGDTTGRGAWTLLGPKTANLSVLVVCEPGVGGWSGRRNVTAGRGFRCQSLANPFLQPCHGVRLGCTQGTPIRFGQNDGQSTGRRRLGVGHVPMIRSCLVGVPHKLRMQSMQRAHDIAMRVVSRRHASGTYRHHAG